MHQNWSASVSSDHTNEKQRASAIKRRGREKANCGIFIENVKRQGKSENRYFNGPVSISTKDTLLDMMRIGFVTANFKPAFIHGYK
eukprot:scaffold129786_cov52-Attheya_sp.AAC.2